MEGTLFIVGCTLKPDENEADLNYALKKKVVKTSAYMVCLKFKDKDQTIDIFVETNSIERAEQEIVSKLNPLGRPIEMFTQKFIQVEARTYKHFVCPKCKSECNLDSTCFVVLQNLGKNVCPLHCPKCRTLLLVSHD